MMRPSPLSAGWTFQVLGPGRDLAFSRPQTPAGASGRLIAAISILTKRFYDGDDFMTESESEIAGPTRLWPADEVQRWPIERLNLYANNPRLHSEADLGKIAASIRKWGWTMPVLVDEHGELICGHARVGAAMLLELNSIPVIVAKGWSEEEKRAYRIADNQSLFPPRFSAVYRSATCAAAAPPAP